MVFGGRDGRIYDFRKAFETARRRAGLYNVRLHDLRHTFASHLVMSGVDLTTVQTLLGHLEQRMTERYSHLSPLHKANVARLLGRLNSTKLAQSISFRDHAESDTIVSSLKTIS